MTFSLLILFHIIVGSIGLLSGAAALSFKKGTKNHRQAGNLFFISMLCMSATGAYIAFMKPAMVTVIAGILTFYLVTTAWYTIRRKQACISFVDITAFSIALLCGISGILYGLDAENNGTGLRDGYPAATYYFFGGLALFAAALDIRMFILGGVSGVQRITRHLWRMCLAMLIATASFFLGQQKVFPSSIQNSMVLFVPVLLVFLVMVYWLLRTLIISLLKRNGSQ